MVHCINKSVNGYVHKKDQPAGRSVLSIESKTKMVHVVISNKSAAVALLGK